MPGEGLLGGPLCPEHLAWRGSGGGSRPEQHRPGSGHPGRRCQASWASGGTCPAPSAPGPAWPPSAPLFHEICARPWRRETGSGAGALLINHAGKAAAAREGQEVRRSV